MGQYPEVWLPRTPHRFGPNLESDLGPNVHATWTRNSAEASRQGRMLILKIQLELPV